VDGASTALAFMDDAGIDVAMLSISTPGSMWGDDKRARGRWPAACNEFSATARPVTGRIGSQLRCPFRYPTSTALWRN